MSDAETPAGTPPQGAGNKTGIFLALAGLLVLCAALYWGCLQEPETPPPATPPTPVTPEVKSRWRRSRSRNPRPSQQYRRPRNLRSRLKDLPSAGERWGLPKPGIVNAGQLGEQFIMRPNGLERGVAIVDNLRRAVPYKLRWDGR